MLVRYHSESNIVGDRRGAKGCQRHPHKRSTERESNTATAFTSQRSSYATTNMGLKSLRAVGITKAKTSIHVPLGLESTPLIRPGLFRSVACDPGQRLLCSRDAGQRGNLPIQSDRVSSGAVPDILQAGDDILIQYGCVPSRAFVEIVASGGIHLLNESGRRPEKEVR